MDIEELIGLLTEEDVNKQLPNPQLLQYYKNAQDRIFWLNEEIDDDLITLVRRIIDYNREDKDIPIEQRKPIRLFFNSVGGSVNVANVLTETIKLSKTPVYGYTVGLCASAASVIFLACHKRYASKSATFLWHKGSCPECGGSFAEMQAFQENWKRDVDWMLNLYAETTTYTLEEIEYKLDRGDWYIYTDEALKNGIIHEVISDIDILY